MLENSLIEHTNLILTNKKPSNTHSIGIIGNINLGRTTTLSKNLDEKIILVDLKPSKTNNQMDIYKIKPKPIDDELLLKVKPLFDSNNKKSSRNIRREKERKNKKLKDKNRFGTLYY